MDGVEVLGILLEGSLAYLVKETDASPLGNLEVLLDVLLDLVQSIVNFL